MTSLGIPVETARLANGLRVVVSPDRSAPVVLVGVYYRIGFRLEPEGRSGFAHLFEHMMFQGSENAGKMMHIRLVNASGGVLNGSTAYDYTNYFEVVPSNALERMLWLEADRMRALKVDDENLRNQRDVVKEEVRVNVLNRPYGSFMWLDLPQKAFDKFPNAHNFYGDFKDLDAATIQDVRNFFQHYYAPNNAVLVVAGDVKPAEVFEKAEKYFGGIAPRDVPPRPDISEAPQEAERDFTQEDKLAKVPAIAIGYRMPPRTTHDAVVGAVTGELLHNGQASLLYQALVKEKKLALSVDGGLNWPLGNPFEYNGPTLMTTFMVYPPNVSKADLVKAYDGVIQQLASEGVSQAALERIRAKMRSDWYAQLEQPMDRASVLSHATLFDGTPDRVNQIPDELSRVTSEEIKEFAKKYLVSTNRTIIDRVPAKSQPKPQGGEKGAEQ